MAEHHIRRATYDDFDDVMKIGEVIPFDYLSFRYHSFMDDSNATSYVYVIGDEVVGFLTVFLLDDGQTYHVRAGRVKDGYRGHGVYGKLSKHARDDNKRVASICQEIAVVEDANFKVNKERLLKTLTELYGKNALYYKIAKGQVLASDEACSSLQGMTAAEMMSLFQTEKIRDYFFPANRIIVDYVPLRLLASNMKYILGPNTLALASENEESLMTLISVGSPVPCLQERLRYCIDIFGSDVTRLHHHIVRHIQHAKDVCKMEVILQILVPCDETMITAVEDNMASLGLSNEKMSSHNMLFLLGGEFK